MLDDSIRERLAAVEVHYEAMNNLMADPGVATNPELLRQYAQEAAEMADLVRLYRRHRKTSRQLAQAHVMSEDDLDDASDIAFLEFKLGIVENTENLDGQKVAGIEYQVEADLICH